MDSNQYRPSISSLEAQLSTLQTRIGVHGARLWQLPFTYVSFAAIAASVAIRSDTFFRQDLFFFVLSFIGLLVAWAIYDAWRSYQRTAKDMNKVERMLRLEQFTLCKTSQVVPYFAICLFVVLVCGATGVFFFLEKSGEAATNATAFIADQQTQDLWIKVLVPAIPSAVIAAVSVVAFRKNALKDRIAAMEQNFDVLQRLNETALQNDKNLMSAIRSATPDDEVKPEEARRIFFHYLRINRLMRAYEYGRIGVLKQEDVDRIFQSYAATLCTALPLLDGLAERRYPSDFIDDLRKEIALAEPPTALHEVLARAKNEGG